MISTNIPEINQTLESLLDSTPPLPFLDMLSCFKVCDQENYEKINIKKSIYNIF